MKPFILAVIAGVFALNGCCKVYCPRQQMTLAFVNFTRDELDTITIKKLAIDGFLTPLDSMSRIIGGFSGDTLYFSFIDSDGFDRTKNYDVVLPAIGRRFRITNITTRKYDCNCGQRDGRGVAGYTLDGTDVISDVVYLNK